MYSSTAQRTMCTEVVEEVVLPGKKCEPGCMCDRHASKPYVPKLPPTPEETSRRRREAALRDRENRSQRAKEQFEREGGSEARSRRAREMWANRTPEERKAIGAKTQASRGKIVLSPEHREALLAGLRKRWDAMTPEERREAVAPALRSRNRPVTKCELEVAAALDFMGIEYEFQHPIGSYLVDFLLPAAVVIEVDGAYWHDAQKDRQRDAELSAMGFRVLRITEEDANADPVKAVSKVLLYGNARGV